MNKNNGDSNYFNKFTSHKYICIESFRKNGTPVRTPVWFVENKGSLFVRTGKNSGKVKRIKRNPNIRVAICDFRGKLKSEWIDATASSDMSEHQRQNIYQMLQRKYGLLFTLSNIIVGKGNLILEIFNKQ
jgi:PPOX class probable F420-dependent enzyme